MLKRWLPKGTEFFDLLEEHARTMVECVDILDKVLLNLQDEQCRALTSRIETLENTCDSIAHKTVDRLRQSFITPFDRDEIRILVSGLDDIVDYIEAAAHRIILYEVREIPSDMEKICATLQQAAKEVEHLVVCLRSLKTKKDNNYKKHLMEINRLENEGDRFHRNGIASLFHNNTAPLTLIKLKEIYEMLESAIDRCEDVANVIEGIAIEHVG